MVLAPLLRYASLRSAENFVSILVKSILDSATHAFVELFM